MYCGRSRGPKNPGPVVNATFATIVNPALHIGLAKDRGGHLVNQRHLSLFDKC